MLNTKINHFLWHSAIILMWVFIALNLISVWNFSYALSNTWSTIKESMLISFSDDLYSDEVELNSAPEYSDKIMEMKNKYEEKFNSVIWNKLDNLTDDKLQLIIDKIDSLLKNTNNNKKIWLVKKDKIISQLLALKDIIFSKMSLEEYSIDIDLENILEI